MPIENADLKGRKVLFIAYFYPPVSSQEIPGAMRTIKFIRNLSGGSCDVLTVPPGHSPDSSSLAHLTPPINGETLHYIKPWNIFTLLLALRSSIKKTFGKKISEVTPDASGVTNVFKGINEQSSEKTSHFQKLKDYVYNLCYFPDQAGPWVLPGFLAGTKIVKKKNTDLIFATGSPWSSLWIGYLISKNTGLPLIVDFRDPWMNNPFHQSRGCLLDKCSRYLERKIVEHATAITLNTEPLKRDFLARYPKISPNRFYVLPNGFDSSEFEDISSDASTRNHEFITLSHAGFLYGVRDPSVLLNAIRKANNTLGPNQPKIQFKQIGDVSLSFDIKEKYADMINDKSLIIDPPIPYTECLETLAGADYLVNIQPSTTTQIPSKLYDYLALNKPILNITPNDGALGALVTKHKLGAIFEFEEEDQLTEALIKITETNDASKFRGYQNRDQFDCARITVELANIITSLTPD